MYEIENLIFPPQNFCSPGLIIEELECSICGKDPEDCDHMPQRVYMGKICTMIAKKIRGVEVSLIFDKEPDSKKARLDTSKIDGVSRNIMTWKEYNKD